MKKITNRAVDFYNKGENEMKELIMGILFISFLMFSMGVIITIESLWSVPVGMTFAVALIAIFFTMWDDHWKDMWKYRKKDNDGPSQIRWFRY